VYVIPKMEVDLSTPEGLAAMKAYFDEAVAAGFEGIMIKDPKAGYEGRKYSAWLKWKPTISVTLKVVGLQQGEPDSAFAGTLGALVLEGWDDVDDKTNVHIKSNCGSGFDVKTRQGWWDNPETIMGFMVEIEADAITLNKDATQTYSLRFPRLKGVRGTKPGEKI
jgi:DNA ligase-1